MSQRVTVSIVGVNSGTEQRMTMALRLLAASGIEARLMPWDGTRRDLVIADIDDAYGRAALDLVRRRGDGALAVSRGPTRPNDDTVAIATTQLTELVRRIKALVSAAPQPPAAVTKPSSGGLLQLCIDHREHERDLLARSGASSLIIRRAASRIMAPSHSDLAAARTRLLGDDWSVAALDSDSARRTQAAAAQSLDAFLIEACEAARRDLPWLSGERHRLDSWPDLGSIPDNTQALRMSSALVRGSWSLDALAAHCNVERSRANAFCWATRASGLLTSDSAASCESPSKRARPAFSGSLLARLARRFNLSLGAEPRDAR